MSHGSALHLYGAADEAGEPEATVPNGPPSSGVGVSALDDFDWQPLHGLPVTTPARTLVDVADRLDVDELDRIICTLINAGHATKARLKAEVPTHLDRLPVITRAFVLLQLLDVPFE